MRKRWKVQEIRIARFLGLRHNLNTGAASPDAEGDWLVVEVKDRSRFPTWIESALLKVEALAQPGQLGIVVLTGPTSSRDLVVMDLRQFREYLGEQKRLPIRR